MINPGMDSSECFYCKSGFSSRCEKSQLLGSAVLDGGQAEYVSWGKREGEAIANY